MESCTRYLREDKKLNRRLVKLWSKVSITGSVLDPGKTDAGVRRIPFNLVHEQGFAGSILHKEALVP